MSSIHTFTSMHASKPDLKKEQQRSDLRLHIRPYIYVYVTISLSLDRGDYFSILYQFNCFPISRPHTKYTVLTDGGGEGGGTRNTMEGT